VSKSAHISKDLTVLQAPLASLWSLPPPTADAAGARLCGCHCGSTVEPAAAAQWQVPHRRHSGCGPKTLYGK